MPPATIAAAPPLEPPAQATIDVIRIIRVGPRAAALSYSKAKFRRIWYVQQ